MAGMGGRRRRPGGRVGWLLVMLGLAGCGGGAAPEAPVGSLPGFQTWQDRKYQDVVRQETDFTCGAASLSTISQHYYRRPVAEKAFSDAVRARLSDAEWGEKERDGLSLLDMKRAAEALGFKAEGLKLTVADAAGLAGPVVVHLDKGYIRHFSVLREINGDRAYLADPVLGNVRLPLWRFAQQWTGYALAIWVDGQDLPPPHDHRLAVTAAELTHERHAARRALYARPMAANLGRF